jgi:subtilisin family serine protease
MKLFLQFILLSISVSALAQTKISSETKSYFKSIEEVVIPESITKEWVAINFPNLPIYQVFGECCISVVASVSNDFVKEDLIEKCFIGCQIGEVVTLKIPLANVSEQIHFENVEYLKIAERIQPLLSKATADMRVDSVWQGINLPQSFTGANVLIGITDWGFDYDHPMFMDTTLTTSRVRAAWDHFKIDGSQPSGMGYGVEYDTPTELANAHSDTASTYYDYATHGSHVAGIAAGSGAGLKYRGVAFEAEYLFNSIQLEEGAAIDAFNWMKTIADADSKRLVVNMSWGLYYMGTMDGTSLVSQAINTLSDQGVVFVTSAGNNGNDNLHIKKTFVLDSIRSQIQFYGYSRHPQMWGQCIYMWGEPNNPFSVKLEIYNSSNNLIGASNIYNTQLNPGYHDTIMVIGTDTIFYNYTIDAAHPQNSRPHIRMRVKNTNTNYKVVMNSFAPTGTVHYWNVVELSNGVGNWGLDFMSYGNNGVAGNSEYSLGEPACTESAITIAAHVSEVVSQSGVQYPGSLAGFSSEGPTYDERMKPDVSAPGSNVISSLNSYTTGTYTARATVDFNSRTYVFSAFSGTSMSSPGTAGVAALVLEANPNLSSAQVKNIIKSTARQDSKTGVITAPGTVEWGMGKVNAYGAVYLALNTVSVTSNDIKQMVTLYPNPVSNQLFIEVESEELVDVSYQIFDVTGKVIKTAALKASQQIDVSNWSNGVYFVRINGKDENRTLKFIKQ